MSCDSMTVGALLQALLDRFPAAWAESWDRVGLIAGDAGASVTGALVTLDASAEAVMRAVGLGANVVVTHHPPYLEAPERMVAAPGPAGAAAAAVAHSVAVISLHTNLDRAPEGATALARTLGLSVISPLESSTEEVALLVTYAPAHAIPALRAAMTAAGAGRIGEYDACAFTSEGRGHFDERTGARAVVSDEGAGVPEMRLEMVAPPAVADAALQAARAVHPYEEPVLLAIPTRRLRGAARLGSLCTWEDGAAVGDLADHVSRTLGASCRVWGERSRPAVRIAVANGSAGSLIGDAVASADTLIAGEVRYHDALAASAAGLAIIEAGHDATEWPIVGALAGAVRDVLGTTIPVVEDPPAVSWWTTEAVDD